MVKILLCFVILPITVTFLIIMILAQGGTGNAPQTAVHEPEISPIQKETQQVMNAIKASSEILAAAETDLIHGNMSKQMNVYTIGAMLEVIYGTASSIQKAWDYTDYISPQDKDLLKSLEVRLSLFQQKALPILRLAFKERTKETLWEHDVAVSISGKSNVTLKLIGYHFAANTNIKATEEQLQDLVARLRFKTLIIAPSEHYKGGAVYSFKPPADNIVATYLGEFKNLNKHLKQKGAS